MLTLNVFLVKMLLRRGVKLRGANGDDKPLFSAMKRWMGTSRVAEYLLDEYYRQGIPLASIRQEGFSVLHIAAQELSASALKKLLRRGGADPEAKNHDGKEPADCGYGYTDAKDELIQELKRLHPEEIWVDC